MSTVTECIRQHSPAFLKSAQQSTPLHVRKVLSVIARCRTGELGHVIYHCQNCNRNHWVGRSCGNRHCPTCQHEKTQAWLRKQSERLQPVHHFLVTCTVPKEVRDIIRSHRETGFDAIFDAGAQMLRACAAESRYLRGGQLGFFGVLHTWGRDPMRFHPHVHFVVPGGAVSNDGSKWLATPTNFLFVHSKMIAKYKAFFKARMEQAGLLSQIPSRVWSRKWVVDVKPVGGGRAVLKYLAPYVYRVAITDNRIVECNDTHVTYRYTPSKTKRSKLRQVTGHQFVQGFAQHVLPKGFRKVRHYGWCASHSRTTIDRVRWLIWLWRGWTFCLSTRKVPPSGNQQPPAPRCSNCGGDLLLVRVVDRDGRTLHAAPLHEHPTSYLDSG